MHTIIFGLAAIALYITVAVQTSAVARKSAGTYTLSIPAALMAVLALVAHAIALYPMLVTRGGINFGVFSAASLVAWLIACIAVVATLLRPVASLSLVILPFAAVIVAISLVFTDKRLLAPTSTGIALHIALSLVAYSLFAIAALQAIYLAFAEHRLRNHEPVVGYLPPLPTMERLMFELTAVAFALLSVGIAIGSFYIHDVHKHHLDHKIFFSVMAWLTFAVLLIGRYHWHWRGRRAIKYVIGGFALLALGFFGSKIVLELILHRPY